ncbi:hypothetical protein PQE71_gp037 [Bacillus phage Izhevsk]|uniref:Uncharacterized protein n=1 Tax=Bacillus phage Izhevsk TaxID=2724322 RepID=A0A6H0X5Y6_9CAUD|nr:hypothetical protein PQE71_gp037 [Bacillus phage Izhevsk]QIW89719.1 hypothetical protein Izhevsk_37 [Bacillus phage Izhevsk]
MIIAKVFKDGKLVDQGIVISGKKWVEAYPEQYVEVTSDTHDYGNGRTYNVADGYHFQELQDNGNGWEVIYDSNEKIDRTVDYDLPSWFVNSTPIPDFSHKMDKDGNIEETFHGYIK